MSYLFVKHNRIFLSEGSGKEKSSTLLKQYDEKGQAGIVLQEARKAGFTIPEIVEKLVEPVELTEEVPAGSYYPNRDCRKCPEMATCQNDYECLNPEGA